MTTPIAAETMSDSAGRQYHLGAVAGDIARCVVLVGDPARAERGAACLRSVRFRASHREYQIYTGEHAGLDVSIISVGIGSGAMELAVVELCQIVEEPILIRAGSCGGLVPELALGHLVISQAAVRMEGASLGYVEPGYPAFAHAEAQLALIQAAAEQGVPHHVGVTATAAGFYGAQGRHVPGFAPRDEQVLSRLRQQGVLNLEMECSCLFTLAALRGLRAGAVCAVFANRELDVAIDAETRELAEQRLLDVALGALHHLAAMERERAGLPHWHPGLRASSAARPPSAKLGARP
jgi:uridine phosphorylase